MSVHRFLVSGTDEELMDFHLVVLLCLNAIERRGDTVLYTCMDDDTEDALRAARAHGVTLQEWDGKKRSGKYW